jgi:hypothetical protein
MLFTPPSERDNFSRSELSPSIPLPTDRVKPIKSILPLRGQGLEVETDKALMVSLGSNHTTTNLVRLYLQDIGRIKLLGREEEVAEARHVHHYMQILGALHQQAKSQGGSSRAINSSYTSAIASLPSWAIVLP